MALRLRGATSGYIELKAPASAGDNTLTLPVNNGSANQLLKTDGSGNLSWTDDNSGVSLSGSTNNTIATVTGANALQGEADLTFDGSTLGQSISSSGEGITLTATGNHYANIKVDANRTGAGNTLLNLQGHWNGTEVASIVLGAGADTTNKDDGILRFFTATSGSSSTERVRIDSNGDLNLGNNPTNQYGYKLNIQDSAILYAQTASSNGTELKLYLDHGNTVANFGTVSTSHLAFITANNERLRIDSSGKVGIGTTSPSTILEVKDSTDTGLTITAGNTVSQSRLLFSDGTVDANVSYDHNDRKLYLGTASSSGLDGDLVIDSSGKVGIGTASPDQELHVYNSATDSSCYIKVQNNRSRNAAVQFTTSQGSWYIGQGIGADVDRFMIYDSTSRLEVFDTGCVGINGVNCNQFSEMLQVKTHNNDGYGIAIRHLNDGGGSLMRFSTFDGSNEQLCGSINGSGTSTSFNTSSDYRLKENIVDFTDGITKLKTLKPKRFNWISDPTNTTIDGFLAHEITAVPEAVWGTKDATEATYWTEDEKDSLPEGKEVGDVKNPAAIVPQQLDQSKLVPLITAALKEAIAKIETLETKVAALESA